MFIDRIKETEERRARYGVMTELFFASMPGWNGAEHMLNLINCSNSHDFFMNCLVEEQTGAFYDQTLYKKDDNPEKLIPRKANMPTKLYGGFSGEKDAYFCIVKEGKKAKIVGIPVRIAALIKQERMTLEEFLVNDLEMKKPVVLKDRVKKYQHVLYESKEGVDEFYMVAAKEVINARQLWLSPNSTKCLDNMLSGSNVHIDDFTIEELYREICDRIIKYYPCYRAIGQSCLEYKDDFMKLPFNAKVKHLQNILTATHANSTRVDNWKVPDGDITYSFNIKSSRLRLSMSPESIVFVDSSITGMKSRSYKLEL